MNFVWTAAHVVENLRHERQVITSDGTRRTIVEFDDAKIVKQLIEKNRLVGRLELDAEVVRYSDASDNHDLALLRLRKRGFINSTVVFYLEEKPPDIGTDLLHVGSLLGQMGAGSMTSGIYSQHGRLIGKVVFDQIACPAFPGSSGGGVFLRDGRYVGMVVRGAGETFTLTVPVRRIKEWAESARIKWAIDPSVPLPEDEELRKLPVEDVGALFDSKSK